MHTSRQRNPLQLPIETTLVVLGLQPAGSEGIHGSSSTPSLADMSTYGRRLERDCRLRIMFSCPRIRVFPFGYFADGDDPFWALPGMGRIFITRAFA